MDSATDEMRMFCYKVTPCRKHYSHDWSDCPYSHEGEKAQRRCPRTHAYTGLSCPDMKKNGECPRGDKCQFSHNSFEYWLHPSRYRSQFCTFGTSCRRPVCFFAHTVEELRMPSAPTRRTAPTSLGKIPAPGFSGFLDSQDSSSLDYLLSSGSSSPVDELLQVPSGFSPQQHLIPRNNFSPPQQLVPRSAMLPRTSVQRMVDPLTCEVLRPEYGVSADLSSAGYMYATSPEASYASPYANPQASFPVASEQRTLLPYLVSQSGGMGMAYEDTMAADQQMQSFNNSNNNGDSRMAMASASILRAASSNQNLVMRRPGAGMQMAAMTRAAFCSGDMMQPLQQLYGRASWPLQAA